MLEYNFMRHNFPPQLPPQAKPKQNTYYLLSFKQAWDAQSNILPLYEA